MNKWSHSSIKKLETCHPDLQTLFNEVLSIHDCTIVYGRRSKSEQDRMYQEGKSKLQYPRSKHNDNPSSAADVIPFVNGSGSWDRERIILFGGIVLAVADRLYNEGLMTHKIRWGGNWSTNPSKDFAKFFDGAHFELYK